MDKDIIIGTVIKLHVKDTNPPKEKRFVVVGRTEDNLLIATVYFNSKINKKINWAKELIDQNIFFEKEGRPYIYRDSYLDCSKLTPRDYKEIAEAVKKKPESILGIVSKEDLEKN